MLMSPSYFFPFIRMGFLSILVIGQNALASAPFCAQSQTTSPQCYYYDAQACRKEASAMDGICVVNEESVNLPDGYGNYCLVLSSNTLDCLYLDINSCNEAAKRQNGICLRNYTKPSPLPSYEYKSEDAYQAF